MKNKLLKILDTFKLCAQEAGKILKEEYEREFTEYKMKSRADYVSEVDFRVEKKIKEILKENFEEVPFIGEETGGKFFKEGFVCDPLDGTRNFIQRIPFFAFSIAYVKENEPYVGVIYIPLLNELFYAIKGGGAYLNGKRIKVSSKKKEDGFLIGTGFPFRKRKYWEIYYKKLKEIFEEVDDLRRPGSASCDLAYVACGRYDGFFEFGLSPWDILAGVLLVEEAGGKTGDMESKRNHLKTGNIIAGNPYAYDFLLSIFKKRRDLTR